MYDVLLRILSIAAVLPFVQPSSTIVRSDGLRVLMETTVPHPAGFVTSMTTVSSRSRISQSPVPSAELENLEFIRDDTFTPKSTKPVPTTVTIVFNPKPISISQEESSTKDEHDQEMSGQPGYIAPYSLTLSPRKKRANSDMSPNILGLLADSTFSAEIPLLCTGADVKRKKYHVGVCMDGTLMYWTGLDCQSNCKCDNSGNLSCEVASDCGPADAVARACSSEATFSCVCMTERRKK